MCVQDMAIALRTSVRQVGVFDSTSTFITIPLNIRRISLIVGWLNGPSQHRVYSVLKGTRIPVALSPSGQTGPNQFVFDVGRYSGMVQGEWVAEDSDGAADIYALEVVTDDVADRIINEYATRLGELTDGRHKHLDPRAAEGRGRHYG